jgi:hypothetical protein
VRPRLRVVDPAFWNQLERWILDWGAQPHEYLLCREHTIPRWDSQERKNLREDRALLIVREGGAFNTTSPGWPDRAGRVAMEFRAKYGAPIRAISYLVPDDEWDSGYACWSVTPERAADIDDELICINCLLGDHPEAGRGMDFAREHGEAIRDKDTWIASRDGL